MKKNAYLENLWEMSQTVDGLNKLTDNEVYVADMYHGTRYERPLTFDCDFNEYSKATVLEIEKILNKAGITELLLPDKSSSFDILKAFHNKGNFRIKSCHSYGIVMANK